ncbi:MAG TPA: APC family permease, partial [Methanomassiliicoccales archaeon]|nr:APC family permease [Methanomassiliicoccales archaeon]
MPIRLKRKTGLGLGAAIAFGIGSMVGAGVFVLSGLVINTAGPSAILSYLFCGLLMVFSGLSYAALASIFPEDGGGYLYSKRMLGDRPGFLAGWGAYYASTISNAFVLIGFGIYFGLLFSVAIDPRILALIALIALTAINLRGVADAGRTEVTLVVVKLAILILLIIVGVLSIQGTEFVPFAPAGAVGLLQGMVMVFFAYTGFQVASMMAGEIKQSSVKVPIAIIVSILVVIAIYIGVVVALLSARLPTYGSQSVFDAAVVLMGSAGGALVAFAATVSTLSSSNASIVGASRTILSMASERQLPGRFAKMRHGEPWNAIILGSLI